MRELINFQALEAQLPQWADFLSEQRPLAERAHWLARHGDAARWFEALDALQPTSASAVDTSGAAVRIDGALELSPALKALMPWRKGPYHLHGVAVDSEWRSDFKWQRLAPHIGDLQGQRILDVGCGNGYHLWRARGAGAGFCLGVDPSLLFLCQFKACAQLAGGPSDIALLPLGAEALPHIAAFDQVWSMGVIYHRRDPLAHIAQLMAALKPGGRLVLESIICPDKTPTLLVPEKRYARMRNVWGLPSATLMCNWMREAGLTQVRIVDHSYTDFSEQRQTRWMPFESLESHLDPDDPTRTVEGYPAPQRLICIGEKHDAQ